MFVNSVMAHGRPGEFLWGNDIFRGTISLLWHGGLTRVRKQTQDC